MFVAFYGTVYFGIWIAAAVASALFYLYATYINTNAVTEYRRFYQIFLEASCVAVIYAVVNAVIVFIFFSITFAWVEYIIVPLGSSVVIFYVGFTLYPDWYEHLILFNW